MIRPAQQKDISQINDLYFTLFEQMQKYEPDYMKSAYQDEGFLRSVVQQESNFIVFVNETESEINGFVIAQLQESPKYNCFVAQRCVYLMDIVVSPQKRGLGIGKSLIEKIELWGKQHDADYIELHVLASNTSAIKLYSREGYTPFSQSMRKRFK